MTSREESADGITEVLQYLVRSGAAPLVVGDLQVGELITVSKPG